MEKLVIELVLFGAGFVQGLTGFGSALIAMPLLLIWLPMKTVTPLVAALSLVINVINFLRTRKSFKLKGMVWMTVMSLVGIPVGGWLLVGVNELVIRKVFGVVLVLMAVYFMVKPKLKLKLNRWRQGLWGLVAGVIGGMINVNGPLVVSYVNLQEEDQGKRVNMLASYFLLAGMGMVLSHWRQGLWGQEMVDQVALLIPMVISGALLGGLWQDRASRRVLGLVTNGLILVSGLGLLR